MYSRLFSPPTNKSFFLFGPRGTGKTTLIRAQFPDAVYIDLLDDQNYREYLAQPERLEDRVSHLNKNEWVVIDEIQRVPSLLNHVHRLIESKKLRFVLTGSSARKLRKQGVNLLAGRALTEQLYPLVASELGPSFDLKKSLLWGHLPSVFSEADPKRYLQSYVTTYLREEVLQEGLVRNLENFSRFLEAASFSQGSVLNISAVARESSIERKVVESYFDILEDLLIAFRLPVFSKKAKRKLIKKKKFYFFDCGVFRCIRPQGPLDQKGQLVGPALETLIVQEIRAFNSYLRLDYDFYYWHTSDHRFEVDLICYGNRGLKAFEIKHSDKIRDEDLRGLIAFKEDYPMAELFLIYGGSTEKSLKGVKIIPATQCLQGLKNILN